MSRGVDGAAVTRGIRLTAKGAALEALARQVAAHVPLPPSAYLGAGEELAPSSRALPGLDLDARDAARAWGEQAIEEHARAAADRRPS